MPISDWPASERPREKLLARGAAALSDAELLALFLRTGLPGKSAVDLAREVLAHFGSLSTLLSANLAAFCALPGLGEAKYAQLAATSELVRRALAERLVDGETFTSPDAVRDYLRLTLGHRQVEVFSVLFLTAQNRLIAVEELSAGTVNETRVYPREVARRALAHNAAALIVAHNHPGGQEEASRADRELTVQLKAALGLLEIELLDHFIVTRQRAVSFAENGWL